MDENEPTRDDFPTRPEAARRLGIGLRQIRRACERDDIAVYEIGGWPRVRWSEVVAWVEASRRIAGKRRTEPCDERESRPNDR